MQNPVFYGAFLAISWIKPRSVVTNYSECMRSNSAYRRYRDAYATRSQTQSLVCLWFEYAVNVCFFPYFSEGFILEFGKTVTNETPACVCRLAYNVMREVKHDVYGKRQTAQIILILLTFSLALK